MLNLPKILAINGSEKARAPSIMMPVILQDSFLFWKSWLAIRPYRSGFACIGTDLDQSRFLRALDGVNPDIYLDFAVWSTGWQN